MYGVPFELYQNDPLYLAIMANDKERTAKLKEKGAVLSEHIKYALTHAVGSLAKFNEYSYTWFSHLNALENMKKERLISVLRNLREAVGEPMYYSDSYNFGGNKRLYEPEMFSCVLDCFDNKNIRKKWVWKEILDNDRSELAAVAAEHGWLKMPKKRDELIKYASDNNKTECLAWLLDFKNRTADLALEQEKAEKKQMRELNANPNSATELKKLWGCQKQEDGSVLIISCKKSAGGRTEITVPEKIGKDPVTGIGDYAFSMYAKRLTQEIEAFRRGITSVTLPSTIKTIGKNAFDYCAALENINIPEGVESIDGGAFSRCSSLKELTLPDSLKAIGASAFCFCGNLKKINIPSSLKEIPRSAFYGCASLEEINLPDGIRVLDGYCFMGCRSLKKINISDRSGEICAPAFGNYKAPEEITLPKSVQKIGQYAFAGCKSLKTAVISEGTEEIEHSAFAECINLEKVYLPKSLKKIKNRLIKNESPRSIFYGSKKVTAIVYEGSYAEKYCKRNNIPYTAAEQVR